MTASQRRAPQRSAHADLPPPESAARRRLLAGASAAIAAMALGPSSAYAQSQPGIVSLPAPELDIDNWTDANGAPTTFSVAESRGKWVFLKCFQSWCPGCHSSGFPTLVKLQEAFSDNDGLAIAAIQTTFEGFSTNTAAKIPGIRERYGLTIPIGHDVGDPSGEHRPQTMIDYRTGGTPWLILINPAGVVTHNGFHADPDRLIEFLRSQIA